MHGELLFLDFRKKEELLLPSLGSRLYINALSSVMLLPKLFVNTKASDNLYRRGFFPGILSGVLESTST